MNLAVNFYNTLFAIEITAFGIIAAAIFVFLQIVYSQFSYREVYSIFRNIPFLLFLVIGAPTLVLTAAGSFLLSFPEFNSPLVALNDFLEKWVVAFAILLSFLFSLSCFAVFIFANIRHIRPSRVVLLIGKRVRIEQIGDYLLKKYGVPAPDDPFLLFRLYGGKFNIVDSSQSASGQHELSAEEQAQAESQKRELEKKLLENKKRYDKVKKRLERSQDPLEPVSELLLRAINNVDLATINEIRPVLIDISKDFINNYREISALKEWSPYLGIIRKYLEYLTDLLKVHLDMCERQKLDLGKIKVLEISEGIASQLAEANMMETNVVLKFWKEAADNAIGGSRETFNRVIQLYRGLADYAFENGIEGKETWLNEIFRHLGWLGERLISRQGIEERPLMSDHQYFTEYDQLLEALLSFSYEYDEKYPMSYPLIFFDAVDVVFMQLASVLKKTQAGRLEHDIFSCLYTYSSFAEAAIMKGNSRGAALGTVRLKQGYEKLVNESLEESAKEAIGLLVRIGGKAARHRDQLREVDFLSNKCIDQYVMDILKKSPLRAQVISNVWESYIRLDSDWSFVVELGRRLETNFGLMFDWTTGELYPNDDPRRR